MFGIEKDFQNLMEQVYGPLGKKEKEESDRMAKQLVDNAVKEVKEMTETHDLRNQWYDEPVQYETPMTENEEEIEKVKAQIKVLEKKLSFLEELEKTKTPVEEAYKDWWGEYPELETDGEFDETRWLGFRAGYNAAYEEKVSEEPEKQKWDAVRESVKWCKENPDKDPLDWVKPQTPEQVADGLKEAFREAIEQGVVSSVEKPRKSRDALDDMLNKMVEKHKGQTLTDMIYDWWEDIFTVQSNDDMETSISDLVDRIEAWLPKEQSAAGSQNAYVECTVEGFNDALNKIKRKLR